MTARRALLRALRDPRVQYAITEAVDQELKEGERGRMGEIHQQSLQDETVALLQKILSVVDSNLPLGGESLREEPGNGTDLFGQPCQCDGDAKPQTAKERKAARLRQVTKEAIDAYNAAPFTRKNGGNCPNVAMPTDARAKQVKRSIKTITALCERMYDSPRITPEFWVAYFESVDNDPFHSGRQPPRPGAGHDTWKPDFEFLTRPVVIEKVVDRAVSNEYADRQDRGPTHAECDLPPL